MHRVPLFKFFNRESNTFDRFQVAWKFATANKFTPWGFSGWRNGVQTVWFNRVKNDCSLWHDTGGGIFWQFLFLATLLFEYKKNQAWINGSHLSKLPSYRSSIKEREREREMTLVFHSKNSLIKLWSRCHAEIFTGGEYFPIKWRLLPPSSPVDNPNGH